MVQAERHRFESLSNPAMLVAAAKLAPSTSDAGRWNGSVAAMQPTTAPSSTQPALELSIQGAVLMALDRNRNLVIQRFAPVQAKLAEQTAYAPFDPTLSANLTASRAWVGPGLPVSDSFIDSINGQAAITQFFATGATVALGVSGSDSGTNLYDDGGRNASSSVRPNISFTQSLLQGASIRANLVEIRQAQLDVLNSQYELRGFTEQLASDTEQAYLDYILNQRELEIAESGLAVSQMQLDETDALIRSGRSAASDRAAALATVAQRREDRINARSTLEQTRLKFLRLVNAPSATARGWWDTQPKLTQPAMPVGGLDDVNAHVRIALLYRSDLNQARLQAERGDLSVVKTQNGLLPKLDLFATLGRTWFFHAAGPFGTTNGSGFDASAGINFEYPILNRAATAGFLSAIATREQAAQAVSDLAQMVELDVRSAYEEVVRAKEQIAATAATLEARQAALEVEQARYRVGKSTSLLVSVAQQEVLNSRIAQATAVASYLKGLVDLYRLEGSLLERRGVVTSDGLTAGNALAHRREG